MKADLSHAASLDDESGNVDGSPVAGAEAEDVDDCFRLFLGLAAAAAGTLLPFSTPIARRSLLAAGRPLTLLEASMAGPLRLSNEGGLLEVVWDSTVVVAIEREAVTAERAVAEEERGVEIVVAVETIVMGTEVSLRTGVSVGAGLLESGMSSSSRKTGERGRSKIE